MSFTPGPWQDNISNDNYLRVVDRDGNTVVVFGHMEEEGFGNSENARLVAAAPELLTCCEQLLRLIEDSIHTGNLTGKCEEKQKPYISPLLYNHTFDFAQPLSRKCDCRVF